MKGNIEIEKLLERFHQGLTTPEENLTLLRLLEKDSTDLEKIAQTIWDQDLKSETDNKSVILETLHHKLGFENKINETGNRATRFIRSTLKYAAILVTGIVIAWLFFAKNQPESENTADQFYKVTVAYGSKSTIELPDGSVVTLNSGSTLKYPGTFAQANRTVILDGEAFFDVKKNPDKPFLVKTKDITVKVLGTTFNVKSYPDENQTETTLVTGRVEITKNQPKADAKVAENPLVLSPNQKAVFYRESNVLTINDADKEKEDNIAKDPLPLKVMVEKEIKTEIETSWANNILVFNSEPFGDIIKKLERWYNVEVTLKYTKLSPVVFSGKFDKESIQEVLHALSLIEPFKYNVNKDQILIYK